MKMTAPQFSVQHNDMLQRIPRNNTCWSTQSSQKRWNLFFFLLLQEIGLTVLLYLIASFQLAEPLSTTEKKVIILSY